MPPETPGRAHAEAGEEGAAEGVDAAGADLGEIERLLEEELRTSNEEISKARHKLERRVEERTADLTSANAQLHRQINERKRLENELLEIAENERRRIGFDLHDDIGQKLMGVSLLLKRGDAAATLRVTG